MNNVAPCPVLVDTIVSVLKNMFIALIYIQGSNYDPSIGKISGVLTKIGKNKQTQLITY